MLLMSRRSLHSLVEEELPKATLAGRCAGHVVIRAVAHLSLNDTKCSAGTCATAKRSSLVTEVGRRGQWLCIDDRRHEVNRERAERSTVGVLATWKRTSRQVRADSTEKRSRCM
jgi:hypothetical protein